MSLDDDAGVLPTAVLCLGVASAAPHLIACFAAPVVATYSYIFFLTERRQVLLPVSVVSVMPSAQRPWTLRLNTIGQRPVTRSANTPEFTCALSILEYSTRYGRRTHELVPLFGIASAGPADVTSLVPEWAVA